jgi:hypothetical protein
VTLEHRKLLSGANMVWLAGSEENLHSLRAHAIDNVSKKREVQK